MRKMRVLLSVMSLLLLAAGPVLAAGPDLVVLSPKDGSTVHPDPKLGPVVVVQYEAKHFKVVDFTKSTAVNEKEGHIHIWLDDQPFNTIHTASNTWVYGGVRPGEHKLTLELVHSNHTPLESRVQRTVRFTMAEK